MFGLFKPNRKCLYPPILDNKAKQTPTEIKALDVITMFDKPYPYLHVKAKFKKQATENQDIFYLMVDLQNNEDELNKHKMVIGVNKTTFKFLY